jgi:hypothetical protein
MNMVQRLPLIQNIQIAQADHEYSVAIPNGCKAFSFSIQDGLSTKNFRVAYVSGKVATPTRPYLKYPANGEYYEPHPNLYNATLYFASNATGYAQLLTW